MSTTTIQIAPEIKAVIDNLTQAVRKSPTGVSFVSIKGYTSVESGEVSNNLINIGYSYETAKQKDIDFLTTFDATKHTFKSERVNSAIATQAATALLEAFKKPNENRSIGQIDAYMSITGGLKVHIGTGEVYVYGYREKKEVVKEGVYKTVNSADLTIAKNEIRKLLKTGKFTQYRLSNITALKANGQTLEFGE